MRQEELLGLRWSDVDFKSGIIRVNQVLTKSGRNPVFGPPKTKKSRRPIPVDEETVAVLRKHRAAQNEVRLMLGSEFPDHDLVFTSPLGQTIHRGYLTEKHYRPAVNGAGVRYIPFKSL